MKSMSLVQPALLYVISLFVLVVNILQTKDVAVCKKMRSGIIVQ